MAQYMKVLLYNKAEEFHYDVSIYTSIQTLA